MNAIFLIILTFFLSSCAPKINHIGLLGYSEQRRVVIVGEHVSAELAAFYEKKYDALVWFTPTQGTLTDVSEKIFKGFGPSRSMQGLMAELQSINYTVGRWEIIVPKVAEDFFLSTLKQLPEESMAKARGTVVLIDSQGNADIEEQIRRVSKGSFFIAYEFQKY